MATQTIEFPYVTGQTITAKVALAESDTIADSQTATEATNRKGTYTVDFTDLPAGDYKLILDVGANVGVASYFVRTTASTDVFHVVDYLPQLDFETDTSSIATDTRDAILDRVLPGNHDTANTPGKYLQDADTKLDNLLGSGGTISTGGTANMLSHIPDEDGFFTLVRNDSYRNDDGRAIEWDILQTASLDLTNAVVEVQFIKEEEHKNTSGNWDDVATDRKFSGTATVTVASGATLEMYLELTASDLGVEPGDYHYDIQVRYPSTAREDEPVTILSASCTVVNDYTLLPST